MSLDINNTIDKLYVEYQKTRDPASDKPSPKQLSLFDKILEKSKLSNSDKKKVKLKVSNLSQKQFYLLIKKYNYYNSEFENKLHKFCIKVNEKIIINNGEFQIGYQKNYQGINNLLFFIKFYNFMMLDYDNISYEKLLNILEKVKNIFKFIIFQTNNGYHVFILSHLVNYNSVFNMNLMKELGCDVKYIYFTYKNGFKCRLSPKKTIKNIINHKFVSFYGNAEINPRCLYYLNILNKISNLFLYKN